MKNSNFIKLFSNYGVRLWSLFSVFLFVPLYIKFLGIEAYAVIGFYALILGVISFADAGMSSAITKELSSNSSIDRKYSIFVIIEKLYLKICLLLAGIIIVFAPSIAKYWLTSNTISNEDLAFFLQLIGLGTVLQLLSSLYFGALFGINKQVEANLIQFIWSFSKAALVVLLLILVSANLKVFFLWQIFCNIIYLLVLRIYFIKNLKYNNPNLKIILKSIPNDIIKYIGSMTLIAVISAVNSQADKIIASALLSLKVFGYYTIASNLGQIPIIMASPLAISIFPLFSSLNQNQDSLKIVISYHKATYVLSLLLMPVFISLIMYTPEVIHIWTGNAIGPLWINKIVFVTRLLLLGSFFLALQFLPYYLLLSKGKTKYTIYQGVAQIILGLPMLYVLVKLLNIEGIGFTWVIINLGALIFLNIIVFSKYLHESSFMNYFINLYILPFFITSTVFYIVYFIYKNCTIPFYFPLIFSIIISLLINVILHNKLQNRPILSLANLVNFSDE